jgi:predicted DNA-binding transcriptional regulator AlpA
MAGNILRPRAAQKKLGIGHSQFYDLRRKDPTFPKFVILGERARGQFEHELDAWAESRREKPERGRAAGSAR